MKRLFRIGSGLFIYSIIPILSWIVLSHVVGDSRISNVFSITYSIQFVWSILKMLFGSGANIRKEKEKDANAVLNGMFWGNVFSVLIFAIPLIFVDKYIAFFGQDVEFYRIYVLFGIALLFLQTLFSFVIEKLYFEDKEKLANVHLFAFNLINFVVLIFLAWLIKTTWIALSITLAVLLIYVICLYVWQFKKFKIDFKFFKNFKYESANIVSSLFMLAIYLFGFKNAFSAGEEYLVALNLVALCTDTQWDMLGAISTVAKVDISKGRYEYRKEVKNAYIYAGAVILSSVIMSFALAGAYNAKTTLVLIYLAFQVVDMLINPFSKIISTYTQLEYSPTLNTVISLVFKVIRTLLSVVIISPYCTEIGQIVQGGLLFFALLIIRLVKFKVADGKLIVQKEGEIKDVEKWIVKRFKKYCEE